MLGTRAQGGDMRFDKETEIEATEDSARNTWETRYAGRVGSRVTNERTTY